VKKSKLSIVVGCMGLVICAMLAGKSSFEFAGTAAYVLTGGGIGFSHCKELSQNNGLFSTTGTFQAKITTQSFNTHVPIYANSGCSVAAYFTDN
jgi:hypothetical protein